MRLDLAIFRRGLTDSREKARRLIQSGLVSVQGQPVTKPALDVSEDAVIDIAEHDDFVGRGAYKLQGALDAFRLDLTDQVCLDIGASTGGFTEIMLRRGAQRVYAVDVGTGQLAPRLASDSRVVNLEKTDARTLSRAHFPIPPTFCSVDVSFISLSHIIPHLASVFDGTFLTLIKPQFEAGRADVGKGGLVRKPAVHLRILRDFCTMLTENGLRLSGLMVSPVRGGDGNIEYLATFSRTGTGRYPELSSVVRQAFETPHGGVV